MPHGAPRRPRASLRRVPAASLRLSPLQSPGISAWRGRRAGAVDAQAASAALASAVLSADAYGSSGDAWCVPAFPSRVVSGVLRCRFRRAQGVVRPQEVPRREHRIRSDPAYLDPADALSSPHSCARPGSRSCSKRLRTQASTQRRVSAPGEGAGACDAQGNQ